MERMRTIVVICKNVEKEVTYQSRDLTYEVTREGTLEITFKQGSQSILVTFNSHAWLSFVFSISDA